MRNAVIITLLGACIAGATMALAEHDPLVNERQLQRVLRMAFPAASNEWKTRLMPDATMATCAQWHNQPPKEVADEIKQREAKRIQWPADGKFAGDWKRGEMIAQSGYGLRFTDTDTKRPRGGNCYACHELSPDEVSFGTLGVSLKGFGRTHKFDPAYARLVYEKIFNSQAVIACSNMPRFGANDILTVEQIKDVVAFLMDPDSPVNKRTAAPAGKKERKGDSRESPESPKK